MRLVDPNKLGTYRDLVDADVVGLCVNKGMARSAAYQSLAIDLGVSIPVREQKSGWWVGLLMKRVNGKLVPAVEAPRLDRSLVAEKLSEIKQEVERLTKEAVGDPNSPENRSKVDARVTAMTNEFLETVEAAANKLAVEFARAILSSVVIGAVGESVTVALLLTALDPQVDVFMTSDGFEATYPARVWNDVLECVSAFGAAGDPTAEEHRAATTCSGAVTGMDAIKIATSELLKLGPECLGN